MDFYDLDSIREGGNAVLTCMVPKPDGTSESLSPESGIRVQKYVVVLYFQSIQLY